MKTYRVRWEIDIEASSPRLAAEKARLIQENEDGESIATVYQVAKHKTQAGAGMFSFIIDEYEEIDLAPKGDA
jgi:tRNA G37 N-methylase Trm5